MLEQIKIDFEKTIRSLNLTDKKVKLRKKNLESFIEKGFPNKRVEEWKFSDLNQIISANIKELSFFNKVNELIDEYKPNEISIEAPFYGKNVQSMLKLGRAQGVAIVAGLNKEIPVVEYAPKKIKQSVTGNGNASKDQLSEMVMRTLNFKKNDSIKGYDATDALGAAICHFYQKSSNKNTKKSWKEYIEINSDKIIK